MGRWIFLIAFFVSSAALCDELAHVYDANAGELKAATEAIGRDVKDPSPVQLRNVKVRIDPDRSGARMCGEFNAKNGFGAYVGFQKFYGDVVEIGKRDSAGFTAVILLSSTGNALSECIALGMP